MSITEIYHQFIVGLQQTGPIEFIAVLAGIGVWFGRKENILVYPNRPDQYRILYLSQY
jgi:nicotinamide mononucleotide transporter